MAPANTNHDNHRHGRLSHPIPLSQEPATGGERVHGVLRLWSGAIVDELMGPAWANNIMTMATHGFSGLTLGSSPVNSCVNSTHRIVCYFQVASVNTNDKCPNWTVK